MINRCTVLFLLSLSLMFCIVFIPISICAFVMQDGELICQPDECTVHDQKYSLLGLQIGTKFYEINRNIISQFGTAYYVSLSVSNGNIFWSYSEKLDAMGNPNVGVGEPILSPNKKAIAVPIIGNYSYKIIIIYPDMSVVNIAGGIFQWESDGNYLFTTIEEDTPSGFLIYDVGKRCEIFRTDKLITNWNVHGDGLYTLIENPHLLDGTHKTKEELRYYSLDLNKLLPSLKEIKVEK